MTSDFWRPVAESNRSKRFCRPLTKSLIQPAVFLKRVQRYNKFLRCANNLAKKSKIGVFLVASKYALVSKKCLFACVCAKNIVPL